MIFLTRHSIRLPQNEEEDLSMKTIELPLRLMLRVEGEWWRAYLGAAVGHPETPDGPLLVGAIRMTLAEIPRVRDAFIALMSEAMKVHVRNVTGETVVKVERREAPPSERSGTA